MDRLHLNVVEEPAAAYASQLGGDADDEPMESLRA